MTFSTENPFLPPKMIKKSAGSDPIFNCCKLLCANKVEWGGGEGGQLGLRNVSNFLSLKSSHHSKVCITNFATQFCFWIVVKAATLVSFWETWITIDMSFLLIWSLFVFFQKSITKSVGIFQFTGMNCRKLLSMCLWCLIAYISLYVNSKL